MAEIYVWYRVVGVVADARVATEAIFAEVANATGVQGRLLQRPGPPPTWMEVYVGIGDADTDLFIVKLAAVAETVGATDYAEGRVRHVEVFYPPD